MLIGMYGGPIMPFNLKLYFECCHIKKSIIFQVYNLSFRNVYFSEKESFREGTDEDA
jgi:hypothetical protein